MRHPLYVSEIDGSLSRWNGPGHMVREIRTLYSRHKRNLETGADVRAALRAGSSTDLGGYRLAFLTTDGDCLCFDCVRANLRQVTYAVRHKLHDGWRVMGLTGEHEIDDECTCAHCDATIWENPS